MKKTIAFLALSAISSSVMAAFSCNNSTMAGTWVSVQIPASTESAPVTRCTVWINPTPGSSSKFYFYNGQGQGVCHAISAKGGQPPDFWISGQGTIGKATVDGISMCQAIVKVSTMSGEAQLTLILGDGGKAWSGTWMNMPGWSVLMPDMNMSNAQGMTQGVTTGIKLK